MTYPLQEQHDVFSHWMYDKEERELLCGCPKCVKKFGCDAPRIPKTWGGVPTPGYVRGTHLASGSKAKPGRVVR